MAENFRGFLIAFILAGLFVFAIISFSYQFERDNDTNISLTDSLQLNSSFGKIQEDLEAIDETAQAQRNATESDIPVLSDALSIFSSFGTLRVFGNVIFSLGNFLLELPSILGVSPVILGVLIAIITITFIFLIIKIIRVGE